jgi:hypothetical protein
LQQASTRTALQLLHRIARIVDDPKPAIVRAVLDGLFLGARIGKNKAVVTPIFGNAAPLQNPILDVMPQNLIQRRGWFRCCGLFLQRSFLA